MPLLPGKENITSNIKALESTGRPYNQALANALKKAYDEKKQPKDKRKT